jgi:hypothetical protein
MADPAQRRDLEQLSARLAELTEALFDRAPFCRQGFRDTGARLAVLCRGPAKAHTVLQQLDQRWPFLLVETQQTLKNEWERALGRLLGEVDATCNSCNQGFRSAMFVLECAACAVRATRVSDELERFAKTFADLLGSEASPQGPPERPSVSQAQSQRISELEEECASQKEALLQLQQVLDNSASDRTVQAAQLEELHRAKDTLQLNYQILESELNETTDYVERCAEDLDDAMKWQTAQETYAAVYRLFLARRDRLNTIPEHEQTRRDLELRSLNCRHKQILALMRLGEFVEAERMAKIVWDRRREMLPGNCREVRASAQTYCELLRKLGRHSDAEQHYGTIWFTATDLDEEGEEWKLDAASQLAEVMSEQARYSEAANWHKIVLDKRLRQASFDVDKAAAAAALYLFCQQQQELSSHLLSDDDLAQIWNARTANTDSEAILACGHELGTRLQNLGRDDEAGPVLDSVWDKRKSLGVRTLPSSMATALSLVKLSVKTGNLARLETVYYWIQANPTTDQTEANKLWYRYRLACVQAMLDKHAVAELSLRAVLERQRQLFGAEHHDTLQFTQVLAEVVRRQGRAQEARRLLQPLWDGRHRHSRNVLHAIVRIGHLLADILMCPVQPTDQALDTAEAILREAWISSTDNPLSNNMPVPLSSVVLVGDCYGSVLMKKRKYTQAITVLSHVVELKTYLGLPQIDMERSTHLLGRAREWINRHPLPRYRPTQNHVHPMRLADYIESWISTTTTAGVISDR